MDNRDYLIILYDYYGELLNEKQREYFELYYFDNLSLGEISENLDVSRNAVHKTIKLVVDKLLFYEDKLKVYYKSNKLLKILNDINDINLKNSIIEILREE